MRLKPEQLARHLDDELLAIYIVSGDEPLQREECVDALRASARERGFEERVSLQADRRFDWSELAHLSETLSLFASRRIVELRVAGKLDETGRKSLVEFAERPPADVLLIVILSSRVDGATQRTKWFSRVERAGAHVAVWPPSPQQMPGWVKRRARDAGLELAPEAAALLAERGEGNLLACAQEIEKLALLFPASAVGVEQVLRATSDSARYDAFDLVDACFAGEAARAVRIVAALHAERQRLPELLGALVWAMRTASEVAAKAHAGVPFERALGPKHGAWRVPQRRRLLKSAVARLAPRDWQRLMRAASRIDRRAKGDVGRLNRGARGAAVEAWCELEDLVLALSGRSATTPGTYNRVTAGVASNAEK